MATNTSYIPMNIVEATRLKGQATEASLLADVVKRHDILNYLPFFPASNGNYHKSLKAVELGEGSAVDYNDPVPQSAVVSDVEIFRLFRYERDNPIDSRILETCESAEEAMNIRDNSDRSALAGFIAGVMNDLFYGPGTDPKRMLGLSMMRNNPGDGKNLTFDAGGSGNNCSSLWLFEFGEDCFNMRFPGNGKKGFQTIDKGKMTIPVDGGYYHPYVRGFTMTGGVHIQNQHSVLRMGSITDSAPFSIDLFIKMKNYLPSRGNRNAYAVCNRRIYTQIETAAINKSNVSLDMRELINGITVPAILGIPVLAEDSLLDTESAI